MTMADPRAFNMEEPYQEELRGGVMCSRCSLPLDIGRTRAPDEPKCDSWGPDAQPYPPGIQTPWPCSTAETGCLYELRQRTAIGLCLGPGDSPGHTQQFGLCPWSEPYSLPEVGARLPITPKQKLGVGTLFFALRDVEHLSAPGCRYPYAYHGHRISMQEMKGCDTVQALIPGSVDRERRLLPPYHLPFEHDGEGKGRFALSGLADSLGSRSNVVQVYPERYNIRVIHLANQLVDPPSPTEAEVLFHPWCFGVFVRLCRSRLGYLPLDKFYSFFHNLEPSPPPELLSLFPYGYRQWIHYPGDEWLATNPFRVDQLRRILNNAMDPESDRPSGIPGPARGPFPNLPMEIRTMIFGYLTYHDAHTLRLVCREFSHLPPHIWYAVLRNEMPWLWELYSEEPPYFWATVAVPQMKDDQYAREAWEADLWERTRRPSPNTNTTGSSSPVSSPVDGSRRPQIDVHEHLSEWTIPRPPLNGTNWYAVYRDIKMNWLELRSLRNRKRIWEFQKELLQFMRQDD